MAILQQPSQSTRRPVPHQQDPGLRYLQIFPCSGLGPPAEEKKGPAEAPPGLTLSSLSCLPSFKRHLQF